MISSREVTYAVDGLTMVGHLARPSGHGPFPGVLIAHDGIGLTDHQRGYADAMAERGYVALAMDYHGGRQYSDMSELLGRVLPLIGDSARMRSIGTAALEILASEPGVDVHNIAGFGLGAGGSILLELAHADAGFVALALVHPGLPAEMPAVMAQAGHKTTFLLATGSEDTLCTPGHLLAYGEGLQSAGIEWRVNVYGGAKHAFWHPPTPSLEQAANERGPEEFEHAAFHPAHARRMWSDVLTHLGEVLPASN